MNGLMMDDHELTLTGVVERAERLHSNCEVVSRAPDGEVHRTTYGEVVARARRIASALAALGVEPGDRVATLLWNQPEHLELYFAVTSMGAVIHTLNPRLHADELAFIVGDADDKAIVVDETLLPVLDGFSEVRPIERAIVVARGGALPERYADYEELLATGAELVGPRRDENQAVAMCYTSGTTGRPKGVVYSHRAIVLHSLSRRCPTPSASRARHVLPVVPMFHANAGACRTPRR